MIVACNLFEQASVNKKHSFEQAAGTIVDAQLHLVGIMNELIGQTQLCVKAQAQVNTCSARISTLEAALSVSDAMKSVERGVDKSVESMLTVSFPHEVRHPRLLPFLVLEILHVAL